MAETRQIPPPSEAVAAHDRGLRLTEAGAFRAARACFETAVTLAPDLAPAWSNLGMMRKVLGQYDAAIAAHDHAIALDPANPRARVNRVVALLHAGRWGEAWPDYDQRLRLPDRRGLPLSSVLPDLDQLPDLNDVTILATHEDGFGDTLHFMRYLPLLAQRGARVIAWVPEPLLRVTARLSGVRAILASGAPPAFDFHCPMFSLPRVFKAEPDTVPAAPYFKPDPAQVYRWAERLPSDGYRVGFVATGQARPWADGFDALDQRRAVPLDELARVAAISGVTPVNLQPGAIAPPGWYDPMPGVRDFADTAAIIANLDLVVGVDTAIIHLAGAMGRRTLMLDRFDHCWRWRPERSDSPWYPSLTILRQTTPLDWKEPLDRLDATLRALVAFNAPVATPSRPFPALAHRDAT